MSFEKLFEEKAYQFTNLQNNCDNLVSFYKELEFITKKKDFRINNSIIWNMISSQRDQLFIDAVEYIGSLSNFLNKIRGRYMSRLTYKPLTIKLNRDFSNFDEFHHYDYKNEVITNFFGICKNNGRKHRQRLCVCDIDFLIENVNKLRQHLECARHMNAHKYSGIANINNISIESVENALGKIKIYLEFIGLFSNEQISLTFYNVAENQEDIIKDIVDMILCGSISQIPFDLNPWDENLEHKWFHHLNDKYPFHKNRDIFYHNLHFIHYNNPDKSKLFNDRYSLRNSAHYFQFSTPHKSLFTTEYDYSLYDYNNLTEKENENEE